MSRCVPSPFVSIISSPGKSGSKHSPKKVLVKVFMYNRGKGTSILILAEVLHSATSGPSPLNVGDCQRKGRLQ